MNILFTKRWNGWSFTLQVLLLVLLLVVIGTFTSIDQARAEAGYTATVSASSLIIRETPDRKGNPIGSLPQGTKIEVIQEDSFGWAEIEHQSQKGWVAAYYLVKSSTPVTTASESADASAENEQASSEASDPSETVQQSSEAEQSAAQIESKAGIVNANGLRLRQGPDLESKIITLLADSTVLIVHSESGDWYEVTTPEGETGWVSKQYVVLESQKAVSNNAVSSSQGEVSGNTLSGKRIVIDPGHGGKDSGTTGVRHGTLEKDINLSLSMLIADKLRSQGAEVQLTRDQDVFVELSDRVAVAQQFNADLYVSIHHNSGKSSSSGIISFYYSQTKDKPLANTLQHEMILSTGMVDGGTRYGNYAVLRENTVPSVLLELGFLSNPAEEEKITSGSYQQTTAEAIASGIRAYFH